MTLNVSSQAKNHLVDTGFEPAYGARPLKRALQQQLKNPLSLLILEGKFQAGDCIEVVVVKDPQNKNALKLDFISQEKSKNV